LDEIDIFNEEITIICVVNEISLNLIRNCPVDHIVVIPIASVDINTPRISYSQKSVCNNVIVVYLDSSY
jgi:hypothetical protein